jgi:anti-sigma factor RsiW
MSPCPSIEILLAHLHGEDAGAEAEAVARHLAACPCCPARLEDLLRRDASFRAAATGPADPGPACPGDESLRGFLTASLSGADRSGVEMHLAGCARCAAALAMLRDEGRSNAGDAISSVLRRRLESMGPGAVVRESHRDTPTPRALRAVRRLRALSRPGLSARPVLVAAAVLLVSVAVVRIASTLRGVRPDGPVPVTVGPPEGPVVARETGPGAERPPDPPGRPPHPASVKAVEGPAAVVARLDAVSGEAFLLGASGESPARAGQLLDAGSGLRTGPAGGRARLVLYDGSRLELGGGTTVRSLDEGPAGKRVELARGVLVVEAVPQPAGRPLVLVTPHAEATVVGTRFALWVAGDRTRVAVTEGSVRLARPGGEAAVAVVAGGSAGIVAGADPVGTGPAMAARPADALVESVGVNVHLHYANTPYAAYDRIVFPALRESGIRHIRDGVTPGNADTLRKLADLHDRLGVRSALIAGDPRPYGCTAEQAVAFVRALGARRVSMVEGPNEYDLSGDARWPEVLRERQRQLHRAMKGDPETAGLPVAAPSLASYTAPGALGDVSAFCDLGNLHNYYGGRNPGTSGWGADGYGSLSWNTRRAVLTCDGKPIVSTETGWHNRLEDANHPGVPEDVAATYLPRLFLRQLDAGIVRTYAYELIDCFADPGSTESHFGLLRHDGTPKPAFAAVRNLLALMRDPGPAFAPAPLAIDLEGDLRDVSRALFQRRDGTFLLVLWQEVPGYDVAARRTLPVPPRDVRLRLAAPVVRAVTWRPVRSAEPQARADAPRELAVQVPDDPLVIELAPADGGR